jgi:hypothetical protein
MSSGKVKYVGGSPRCDTYTALQGLSIDTTRPSVDHRCARERNDSTSRQVVIAWIRAKLQGMSWHTFFNGGYEPNHILDSQHTGLD